MENRLRNLRKIHGLTQVRLAEKANVPRSVIARFETGRTELSTKSLIKIAEALDCSMEEILKGGYDLSRVLVVCGKGNNAGDGAAIARMLMEKGLHPLVYLAGGRQGFSDEMARQMRILEALGADIARKP